MIPAGLSYLVIVAALFAAGGLVTTMLATLKFGQRSRFAPPAGSPWRGVRYAFLAGMMPWAKESTAHHLPTYVTGILYHLGIAAGFLVLIATMLSFEMAGWANLALRILAISGAAAGIGLIVKRVVAPVLRAISTPDDFISNGLVTLFLIAAAATLWTAKFATAFLIVASLLLLYVPLGKIRHCVFFFLSRITFGRFFGRRGVLPRHAAEAGRPYVGR